MRHIATSTTPLLSHHDCGDIHSRTSGNCGGNGFCQCASHRLRRSRNALRNAYSVAPISIAFFFSCELCNGCNARFHLAATQALPAFCRCDTFFRFVSGPFVDARDRWPLIEHFVQMSESANASHYCVQERVLRLELNLCSPFRVGAQSTPPQVGQLPPPLIRKPTRSCINNM